MERYDPDTNLRSAIIVDIDGTVAINPGHRSPYDYSKVSDDEPNSPVIDVINALVYVNRVVPIYVSGREDWCRWDTERWLNFHAPDGPLFMRPTGDQRPDHMVKREIFDRHIRHHFAVTAVFDDRNRVVKMWRDLGLTCFQVANGDF